jgi:hypothetical protein
MAYKLYLCQIQQKYGSNPVGMFLRVTSHGMVTRKHRVSRLVSVLSQFPAARNKMEINSRA